MKEDYVLEKPVFIENSFVFPIYNQAFSRELIDVNPNARFNTTFVEYQSQRIFLTENNEIYIGYLYRKMMNYCNKQKSIALYFKFMFISRFLGELIWKNHFLSEKFR